MGYIKQGGSMLIWGAVGKDVRHRDFPSGKSVTNFSVRIGFEAGDGPGRKKGKYLDVDAWKRDEEHDLALYCSGLEPGDIVLCAGELERDGYQSDKKGEDVYKLNAETVLVQPFADADEYAGGYEEEDDPPPKPKPRREKAEKPAQQSAYGGIGEYDDPGMVDLPDEDLPDFLR